MKTVTRLLSMAMLCLIGITSFGQSAELTGIRRKEFKGVHEILNSQTQQIEGYYTFYVNEKEGKGMVNFIVALFDTELKLVKQTPISMTKRTVVENSEFNGNEFLFVFKDMKKKTISLVSMDKSGEIIKTKGLVAEKRYLATATVYPADDGFFIVRPIKEKKWGYSVEKVDRELNTKWDQRYMPETGVVIPEHVESAGDKVIMIQLHQKSLMSKKTRGQMVCLNGVDGKTIFEYALFDGSHTKIPTSFMIDKSGQMVFGGMYFEGEKWKSMNSDGIFFTILDKDGKKVVSQKTDWENGLQKHLKGSKRSVSIAGKPKVYFHEITQADNGAYQIISETFRTSIPILTNSRRYIGRKDDDARPKQFEIMDYIIFNFSPEGNLVNLHKIEKEMTKVLCYPPYSGMGGLKLARIIDQYGLFGFQFVASMPNSTQKVIIGKNFAQGKPYISAYTIEPNGEYKEHKMMIERKANRWANELDVLPALPGKICIYTYVRKEKTVSLNIEKLRLQGDDQ